MDPAKKMRRSLLALCVLALTLALTLTLTLVAPSLASAHVRDRDKHRLCNGYKETMRHRHEGRLLRPDWYFYTRFDYRSGKYVHYDTWKRTGSFGRVVDRHNKVVNCRRY